MSNDPNSGGKKGADPFDLQRFVEPQRSAYPQAVAELRQGAKRSHWMWYIFPQLRGLGYSATAQKYAISSKDEASAYLAHPVLGPRLTECTQLVLNAHKVSAREIFPYPDDLKFRSSMTLFAQLTDAPHVFSAALQKYYGGEPDRETLRLLERGSQ
ncbi:MAG: DUF1810 domain-containing protein [Rhodomicrobium sp.]